MDAGYVCDGTAQMLENAGLWRRASARWLDVMMQSGLSPAQRAWICNRRRYCQTRLPAAPIPEKPSLVAISRAASVTLKRMGQHQKS
ncbi:hypothetical protein NG99_03005 [Erwinia typographi]|uniref:Uncharacterized protein n=1 Tax=Erwinia typographi TaxID=371042 RepID=A0A0A3ZD12_9GAMM|nr:PerC family transcriptional regulator [Erwinia typographi]KGT95496.1 hypothetical protein NG99_03005 [Erwinia typographi]